jgi:hypothetical protein
MEWPSDLASGVAKRLLAPGVDEIVSTSGLAEWLSISGVAERLSPSRGVHFAGGDVTATSLQLVTCRVRKQRMDLLNVAYSYFCAPCLHPVG